MLCNIEELCNSKLCELIFKESGDTKITSDVILFRGIELTSEITVLNSLTV